MRLGPSAATSKWDVTPGELPMWVADMDFDPPHAVRRALARVVAEARFGYASGSARPLAEALAGWFGSRHGLGLDPAWVLFAPGVNAGIGSVLRTATAPGDEVALLTPTYHHFFATVRSNGREAAQSELAYDGTAYSIDWADLEAKLARPRTAAMIVCNPQNPTGNIWDAGTLARIGEVAAANGVLVISDEIHGDLTDPGYRYTPWLAAAGGAAGDTGTDGARGAGAGAGVVMAVSPSKPFNVAGLQCAALVVPDLVLRRRIAAGLARDELASPSVFAIPGGAAAYLDGAEWLDEVRAYVAGNREFATLELARLAPEVRVTPSHATYLMWLDVGAWVGDSVAFGRRMRRETGLIIDPGARFGQGGEGFVRLNIAAPRERVADGVARLARALELEPHPGAPTGDAARPAPAT
ncbi:MAG: aminotransferase class I/II-fold pyridoxal phosphate-dependent enzyme [Bifidobacteriaceae bacterium]|jgi:cystathionine beta-lyase|nr:aminotransferase class I/II-fold pyridoxal phosphate-dependent enzyme [Bifidobacteriaceae bacterium]